MIGSLMSRMGMAEKLSVAQLQQAVQDGTLPAYIGVPLMQDKMQQQQAAQAAAAGIQQQQQPPIAQQVMQEAQAQEQSQGIDQAQSNLPEQFAEGGIINFAKGGAAAILAADDKYDNAEDADDAELNSLYGSGTDNDLIQAIAASGRGGAGIQNIHPSAAVNMLSEKEKEIDKNLHKYGSQGIDAAKRIGLNPNLMMHVMQKETGGLKNPETAKSSAGAQGVMQFMPGTAKQYGINPNNPEEAIPAGAKHLYNLVNHYKGDERLAAMAYNWGQGNVDKWLKNGADPRKIPKETRNYVSSLGSNGISQLAQGGQVRHLDIGGFLGSVVETPIQQIQSAGNTYSQHPEQAALGINTPAEAYAWNSLLGTNYSPTANMLGGPTQAQYAEGAKNGMNMQAGHIADSIAPAVIGAFTAGAGGAAASAGNALGNQYELNQMRGQYLQNPTAFQGRYGMVKGINYAQGGIASIPRFAGEEDSLVQANPEAVRQAYIEAAQMQSGARPLHRSSQADVRESEDRISSLLSRPNPVSQADVRASDNRMLALMSDTKPTEASNAGIDTSERDRERSRGISTANVNKRYIESLPKKESKEDKGINQLEDKNIYYQSAPKSVSGIDALQEELIQDIKDRREKAKQTSEMNKYLALMQAGFGMMGSKALVPLQAVGEGAQQGVGTYAGLLKQENEEAKDISAQRLGLYKYKSAAETKAAETAALERYRAASLGARPDKEDVEMQKIDKALSINPQIRELRERMLQESKNGSLTPESEKRYLDSINKITADIFKNYGRNYTPTDIGTITQPAPPKEPSLWDKITGKGDNTAQGGVPPLPPGYKLQ